MKKKFQDWKNYSESFEDDDSDFDDEQYGSHAVQPMKQQKKKRFDDETTKKYRDSLGNKVKKQRSE